MSNTIKKLKGSAAAVWLLWLAPGSASAAETVHSFAHCFLRASTGFSISEVADWETTPGSSPLEVSAPVWTRVWPGEGGGNTGAWCYANSEGRVRGRVQTGQDSRSPIDAETQLGWKGQFVRDPGKPDPRFTINPSRIVLESAPTPTASAADAARLFAQMEFDVVLEHAGRIIKIFDHYSRVEGQPGQDTFRFEEQTDGDVSILASRSGDATLHPATAGLSVVETATSARFDLPRYSQTIDLERHGVAVNDTYRILYVLKVKAGEQPFLESFAEAFLGDPLEDGTGIVLETTHTPVAAPLAACDATPDPMRFADNGDGTVTDADTGLMWRRCPVGYVFDDAGTPDLADDRCLGDGSGTDSLDWQGALQAAASETSGGHDDWRAPNAKELETLLEACLLPATIDTLSFPDTPAQPFWTATPLPEPTAATRRAWQIDFLTGDSRAADRNSQALVRPVRDTGQTPRSPSAGLSAGDAQVLEGDSGPTTLSFTVALTAPQAGDVSVDYAVTGTDATAGADFTPASGRITIPAGVTTAELQVEVLGDTQAEGNEYLRLELSNPSATAWLRRAVGTGIILDDEPVLLTFAPVSVDEGDADEVVAIPVQLNQPAAVAVSVDYEAVAGTALAGQDFLAATGTLTFGPGESSATLPVTLRGDLVREEVEEFRLAFTNPSGLALIGADPGITVEIVDDDGPGSYSALNDTGVTGCATGDQALLPCPQAGYPGQDAESGRDVTAPDPSDGALGFSFLKRDGNGAPLANQAAIYAQAPWDCVEDQVTGLWWEVKSDQAAGLRYFDHTYTWYDSSGSNDGGDPGTPNGGTCVDAANCDTEKYVAAVNAAGLCGFDDWRLPRPDELFTIAWLDSNAARGIDQDYFPNHFVTPDGRGYWTGTSSVASPASAVRVRIETGVVSTTMLSTLKSSTQRVRLVRGGTRLP